MFFVIWFLVSIVFAGLSPASTDNSGSLSATPAPVICPLRGSESIGVSVSVCDPPASLVFNLPGRDAPGTPVIMRPPLPPPGTPIVFTVPPLPPPLFRRPVGVHAPTSSSDLLHDVTHVAAIHAAYASTWRAPNSIVTRSNPDGQVHASTFSWLLSPLYGCALQTDVRRCRVLYPQFPYYAYPFADWIPLLRTSFQRVGLTWQWASPTGRSYIDDIHQDRITDTLQRADRLLIEAITLFATYHGMDACASVLKQRLHDMAVRS